MPKKIKVVDIDAPIESTIEVVEPVEQVEQVAPIETVEPVEPIDTVDIVAPTEPVVLKKPRAPRVNKEVEKTKVEEPPLPPVVEEPEPVINVVEEEPETNNIKTVELVQCPKCGKKLTQRTLKYSHEAVCPGNEKQTIKKPKREQVAPKKEQYDEPIDDHIERPVMQRSKIIQIRSGRYKNSISHAF